MAPSNRAVIPAVLTRALVRCGPYFRYEICIVKLKVKSQLLSSQGASDTLSFMDDVRAVSWSCLSVLMSHN